MRSSNGVELDLDHVRAARLLGWSPLADRRAESGSVKALEEAGLPRGLPAQLLEALLERFGTALLLPQGNVKITLCCPM